MLIYSLHGSSNRLSSVSGYQSRSFIYDTNGNAISNGLGKDIEYNILNLPKTVKQSGSTVATYTYSSFGEKWQSTGSDGTHDYIDGIVYHNGSLDFIQTEEGRVNGSTYIYVYDLKDHLGNVRVSIDKDPTTSLARVVQEDEYYAFGLNNTLYNFSNDNRYLYNGKEKQTDLTDQYDYGARFYDPVIGRWNVVDPLAEQFDHVSPYNYAVNNPILMVDPDGMAADTIVNGGQMKEIRILAPKKLEPVTGFLGNLSYYLLGRSEGGFTYDKQGNRLGRQPLTGMPPDISKMAALGSVKALVKFLDPRNWGKTSALLKAATQIEKNGLTAVGRALQKHGSRAGSVYPKAMGNPSAINQQAEKLLENILNHSDAVTVTRHHARFGNITDIKIPSGQGARFSADGKKFIGFIGK